jgi:hypothetical protein
MNVKTCHKCGWQLSLKDPQPYCPICHTKFRVGHCKACGKYGPYNKAHLCKECVKKARYEASRKIYVARRYERYEEWLALIAMLKPPYHTLTNDEWLEACRYFGGCAICGNEAIDSRTMLVPFLHGGKYCDWNIVPTCAKCQRWLKSIGLFRHLSQHLNRAKRERLQVILDYLAPILIRRIHESNE